MFQDMALKVLNGGTAPVLVVDEASTMEVELSDSGSLNGLKSFCLILTFQG